MSIFNGLPEIVDHALGLDETWAGQPPRYVHVTTLQRLCREDHPVVDGVPLVAALYDRILENWHRRGQFGNAPSPQNWRYIEQLEYGAHNNNPETILERTIAAVTDENWVNQVPVDSGLLNARPHYIDLVFRAGAAFSLVELKYESNTPLSAAFQVLGYGLVYLFYRSHATDLGVGPHRSPILDASEVHLRVLAPSKYYTAYGANLQWLSGLESAINTGLDNLPKQKHVQPPRMSFAFEAFPADFTWQCAEAMELETRKNVLWALHRRERVFGG